MESEAVAIEWLILADAAQVVGQKLYLLGGGWDTLTVNTGFPIQHRCAVVASFRIPWNETNKPHDVELIIEDQDSRELLKVAGQVEVGRPPGIPNGQSQRAQIAAEGVLEFQEPGTYVIRARIAGQEGHTVPFRIVPGPLLNQARPPQAGAT